MGDYIISHAIIFIAAFVVEVIHATVGMGFGIGITFSFLMLGYRPTEVITALLIAQTTGQLLAAFFHEKFRNVNFSMRSRELKITLILILLSLIGAVIGPLAEVNVPIFYLKIFTALLIISIGVFTLIKRKTTASFSWIKLMVIGLSAGFLKGLTGCGYGPILTSGQLIIGIEGKSAVGITMLAGPIVFLTSIVTYIFVNAPIDWNLSIYMMLAVALASPLGAFFIRRTDSKKLKFIISISSIIMGILIIIKTVV